MRDETTRLYLRLVQSLDRRSRTRDGTILIPWDLDRVRLPPLPTWEAIHEALDRLGRLVNRTERSFRRDWLRDHLPTLRSLAAVIRGEDLSLADQMRSFYGLSPRMARESELSELREEIRSILGGSGGDVLRKSVEAWEEHHRLRRGDVLPRMSRFLEEARRDSRKLFDLPLKERCRLATVRESRHACFFTYRGDYQGVVKMNMSRPWTGPDLRDAATHEAYPGHHVLQTTREWEYLHGDFPREAAVSLAVDPMGPVEEGICECSMRFIGWDRMPEDRLTIALNRLHWGTELNLAWMVSKDEPWRELVRYAMQSGLVDWERAIRDVRYASRRAWGAYGACYWFGARMIEDSWARMGDDSAFYDVLYWRPHTVRTLRGALRRI